MAEIHRGQVSKKIVRAAGLQPGADAIPKQLGTVVLPVLIVNEDAEQHIVRRSTLSDGATVTLFTTPTDRDFFLTNGFLATAKSVLALSTRTRLTVTPSGTLSAADVLDMRYEPVTAGEINMTQSFVPPILLARGSTIVMTHTNATASIDSSGGIVGFTKDISDL